MSRRVTNSAALSYALQADQVASVTDCVVIVSLGDLVWVDANSNAVQDVSEAGFTGVTVRLYVPFALGWDEAIAYLRRRLDEYPAMMFMVARDKLRPR